jgi:voltage-gated potassium channel
VTERESAYRRVQTAVHRLLDAEARATPLERAANLFLTLLIAVNVAAVVLETMPSLRAAFGDWLDRLEAVSVAIFTVEYLARVWTAPVGPRFAEPVRGRIRYVFTPLALIDLLAILPTYVASLGLVDLRYVRAVRLVRMLRVFKIARYSEALHTFGRVFRKRQPELALITVFLSLLLVVASAAMYQAENAAQPDLFSSVPATMWWTITTLTTVGYGDMYPVTPWGRLLGGAISLLGIGFFALPAGILAAAFAEELALRRRAPGACPECGQPVSRVPAPQLAPGPVE